MPVKRWNFLKAKWSHYIALTNKFAKNLLAPDLLDVDAAYQDFCNTIKKAAKKTIPRGNKFAKNLLAPDSLDVDAAYQDFCNTIKKAAKKTIPRGY